MYKRLVWTIKFLDFKPSTVLFKYNWNEKRLFCSFRFPKFFPLPTKWLTWNVHMETRKLIQNTMQMQRTHQWMTTAKEERVNMHVVKVRSICYVHWHGYCNCAATIWLSLHFTTNELVLSISHFISFFSSFTSLSSMPIVFRWFSITLL